MMRKQVIQAVEHEGLETRATAMEFFVDTEKCRDLSEAVKAACNDYLGTMEGDRVFHQNCGCFNWADFYEYVPNEICAKYGFRKLDEVLADQVVDANEHLVDEEHLPFSLARWEDLKEDLFLHSRKLLKAFLKGAENIHYIYTDEQLEDQEFVYRMLDCIRPLLEIEYLKSWQDAFKG